MSGPDDAARLLALVTGRRSVGAVTGDVPSDATVERLLTAAVSAPNHGLTQPWRFVVLRGDARGRIGRAHAAAHRRRQPDCGPDVLAREASRLDRAPIVVVAVCRPSSDDPVVAREDRDAVACAVQNMLLAAHACGLGAIWRTGPMVDEPEVHAALGIEPGDSIVGFVYVGAPAAVPAARPRRPLDEVVRFEA